MPSGDPESFSKPDGGYTMGAAQQFNVVGDELQKLRSYLEGMNVAIGSGLRDLRAGQQLILQKLETGLSVFHELRAQAMDEARMKSRIERARPVRKRSKRK